MTKCTKTGIKIKDTGNGYRCDPFANVDPFKGIQKEEERINMNYDNRTYEALDLNIENYSREELYKLFGFKLNASLTEENMKDAKKVVLKTHPDKSRLDNKYFIFFSKAYKRLYEIYEFQNKSSVKKNTVNNEYYDNNNVDILDNLFTKQKNLKESNNFNKWFNEQFDKHKLEDPNETGYGNWLKSDDDIVFTPQNINKDSMAREIEKRKKEVQTLTPYKGIGDSFSSSSVGGTSLMVYDSNFSSGSLFSNEGIGYTDLRQAYAESVIPVTEDDFHKKQQFRSVDEYKRHRDLSDTKPLSKEEAMRQLLYQEKNKDQESAALAFYYAQQSEKVKKNQENFWSSLKQITH